MKQGDFQPI